MAKREPADAAECFSDTISVDSIVSASKEKLFISSFSRTSISGVMKFSSEISVSETDSDSIEISVSEMDSDSIEISVSETDSDSIEISVSETDSGLIENPELEWVDAVTV